MEGRNIPLIIMLFAGSVISIACIFYDFSLLQTLIFVLLTLFVFYIIGQIFKKLLLKINRDAENRAALLSQEEEEAETLEDGEEAAEGLEPEEETQDDDFTVRKA